MDFSKILLNLTEFSTKIIKKNIIKNILYNILIIKKLSHIFSEPLIESKLKKINTI